MLLPGKQYQDERGVITYNNSFDASLIKRIYTVENNSLSFVRGWQGHKVEKRWFSCMKGSFEIAVIKIDNFEDPSKELTSTRYYLDSSTLTFLYVDSGNITALKALEGDAKLLVFSDYNLGEINDEFRYPLEYFRNEKFI